MNPASREPRPLKEEVRRNKLKTLGSRVLFHVFFKGFFNYFAELTLTTILLDDEDLKFGPKSFVNIDGGLNLFRLAHELHRENVLEFEHKNTSPLNRQTYKLRIQNSITERR